MDLLNKERTVGVKGIKILNDKMETFNPSGTLFRGKLIWQLNIHEKPRQALFRSKKLFSSYNNLFPTGLCFLRSYRKFLPIINILLFPVIASLILELPAWWSNLLDIVQATTNQNNSYIFLCY